MVILIRTIIAGLLTKKPKKLDAQLVTLWARRPACMEAHCWQLAPDAGHNVARPARYGRLALLAAAAAGPEQPGQQPPSWSSRIPFFMNASANGQGGDS
jgi:hypothetical protein